MTGIRTFSFAALLMVLSAAPVYAQDGEARILEEFTLKDAIDYALQHNTSVRNADLDIISARKKVWETTATGLPHVDGAVNYQHLPGNLPVVNFGSTQAPLYNYIFESLRDLGYPPPDTLSDGLTGGPISLAVRNSTTYSVTVSQLVFSGEYIVGLQASKVFLELSKNAREQSVIDTKESVTNSYYTILVLKKNLEILDSSLTNLDATMKETKAMVDKGFLEETDYEQLQVTKNTVENSLKAVQRQQELARMLFKIQLGLDVNTEVRLTQHLDEFIPETESVALLTQEFELKDNISYKMADTQERLDALSVRREKSAYLPSVSAFYQYQDKTNKATFDFTFNNIIGVNASIPLFSSFQRNARVRQAEITLEKSKNNKRQLAKNLQLNVEQARTDYRNAWEKYRAQRENVDLAKKIFRRTGIKFREGMASSMDLTQAHNQYLDSNSAWTSSILELLNTRTRLEKVLNNQ